MVDFSGNGRSRDPIAHAPRYKRVHTKMPTYSVRVFQSFFNSGICEAKTHLERSKRFSTRAESSREYSTLLTSVPKEDTVVV